MVSSILSLRDLRLFIAAVLMLLTLQAQASVPNGAPAALGAAIQDSTGLVYFSFDDNSTNETGFDFAVSVNSGAVQHAQVVSGTGSTTATTTGTGTVLAALQFAVGNTYTVQVGAYSGTYNAGNTTSYSNTITVVPASFSTPSISVITITNESTVRIASVDNSYSEAGYFYEYNPAGTGFVSGGSTAANVSNVSFPGLLPGTAYQFRIRGFQGTSSSPTAYTSYSNVVSVTTPFYAPTGFTATVNNDSSVSFTWTDNSSGETGYEVVYSLAGANNFKKLGTTSANATSATLSGLSPATSYDFKVCAIYNDGTNVSASAYSSVVTKSTNDGFTSATYKQIPWNQAFTYQATTSTLSSRSSWSISNLPTGLSFNSTTGQITGTPTATGVTNCTMSATFASGATASTVLTLRVVLPPTVATTIPAQLVSHNGNASIPLSDKFTDPDTTSAAQLVTSQGTMNLILYDTTTSTQNATPLTVANFLSYIRNYGVSDTTNKYDGTVFHRSLAGFIVQGGSFKVQSSPNNFSSITTAPSPTNEPVNSNTRGTVAMAKLGSDPNSATDQFFFNLLDNSANLDNQNGGFTAFARVAGNGMAVAEAIAALPTVDSVVNVSGSPTATLTDWPLTSSSAAMDTTKVVSITSASKNLPLMTYAITGNTNSSAVTASINTVVDGSGNSSSTLQITGAALGQSNVTVTATDLDGNTVSQTFAVTVDQAPSITSNAPSTNGAVGSAYNFTYTATGYPAPTFSVTSGALPTGLSLSSAGVISGTCTTAGIYTGVVTATNVGGTNTQNFSITVNQSPTITSTAPSASGTVGSAYPFTYTATGYPAPTFSVTSGALPTGLSLSSAGVISGTCTATGTFNGVVTATNSSGTNTQSFSITVNKVPAFTNGPPTATALVGTAYSFSYTASGTPAPTFSVTAGALPTGLTLSSAGAITGTPTTAGTYSGTVTATNIAGTATQNFSITVNQVPAFTNGPPTATAVVSTAYSFSYTASGLPAPTFSVTAGALPTGLTLSSAGAITGTPTTVGTYSGTVTATNTAGTATQNFSITVNKVPAFTNGPATATALVGTAYSFSYTASGTPAPTFSVTAGSLPTGLTLSGAGAITGTPTTAGTYSGTVTATNTAGTATQNFSITVNQVPAFTNGPPTSTGIVSTAYSFSYTANGLPAPTFSVTAGALPTGLTLSSAGAITGTPTAVGTYSGTVTATNSVGTATQNFSIVVNQVPAFTNGPPTATGTVSTAYSFSYTASGTPAPTFSVTAGALPTGLTLSSAGAITGTPTTAGTYTGTVTATNTAGTATQNFSIVVNQVPAFTNGPPTATAVVGTAYSFSYTASGSPTPTFSVTAGALPTGLTLSGAGAITGTPTAVGTYSGTVTATNTAGTATQNFSITVNQVPAFTNGPPTSSGAIGTAYTFTYTSTGSPAPTFSVTAGALPTGLSLSSAGAITGTPTTAGTYTGTVTATNTAGTATQNFSIVIPKLTGTVTLGSLSQTYDGTAKSVTSTTTPSGLSVSYTYNGLPTAPTTAGSYPIVATINDTNYQGTANGTLVISQATASITLSGLTQVYDGTAKSVTAVTTPSGLTVNITYNSSSTAPSAFGSYTVAATISDTNYTGTQGGTLVIQGQSASSWKAQHFTSGQITAGLSADNADPDGDGLLNLAEYAMGTDPLVRNTPPQPTVDANGLTLIFTRPKALPDVTYSAESTDSLGAWNPVTLELITDGPVQTMRARDILSSGNPTRRFMHLIFGTP